MRAKQIWIENIAEIESAEGMGMPRPKMRTRTVNFLFRIADVESATIDPDGKIILQYPSGQYAVEWSQELWSRLEKHFNQDENE